MTRSIAGQTQVVKTLQPGDRGTVKWLEQYGNRLVCVRYRRRPGTMDRYTTVEVVVSGGILRIRPDPQAQYGVQVWWGESDLARQLKEAGAKWDRESKLWLVRGDVIIRQGLRGRIRSK